MKKVKDKSIGRKNIEILGILGVAIIIMCLLNAAGLSKIAGFNKQIGQCFAEYKTAYESGEETTILEVEDEILYTMTHSNTRINGTLIFNIILVAISIGIIVFIYFRLNRIVSKPIQSVNDKIKYIADGDLTIQFDVDNNVESENEVVLMQKNMNEMVDKLKNIITNVINVSGNIVNSMDVLSEGADVIAHSTNDISSAVSEVSSGAVSTAEDTNSATNIVYNIEENINGIKDSTDNLSSAAENMNTAKDNVLSILSEFVEANASMSNNVKETNEQINVTSKNMKQIQKFIEVIKDIASETKLLSLNAAVQAAQTGSGKGFSVIADKIDKLSIQSTQRAEEIEETLSNLLENYDLIIQKMNDTNENIASQNTKLLETKNNFSILDKDINVTVEKIKEINSMVDDLDKLRKGLVDIITSLSSVSEENAASSEEVNASVEELLSTIEQMCNDIKSIKDETDVLLDSITVFNIEEK